MPVTGPAIPAATIGAALADLRARLGARATDADAVREHHARGESYHAPAPPDIVVFPHSTDEVAFVASVSARYRLPIVPFGAGTSLEGHVNATHGGISIDLTQMSKVLR